MPEDAGGEGPSGEPIDGVNVAGKSGVEGTVFGIEPGTKEVYRLWLSSVQHKKACQNLYIFHFILCYAENVDLFYLSLFKTSFWWYKLNNDIL